MCFHLEQHASKWKVIGNHLGFHPGELDAIQSDPMCITAGAPKSYLNRMLEQWLQWAPGDGRGSKQVATLEAIKSAIRRTGLGRVAAELSVD